MRTHRLYFSPKDGKAEFEHEGQFERIVKSLKQKRYVMEIREYRKDRSTEQNRYYWGVCLTILESDGPGYSKEEYHQMLTEEHLSYEKNGKKFVRSTTSLNTAEMEEYLSNVRMWASVNCNVYLPMPNESHWADVA